MHSDWEILSVEDASGNNGIFVYAFKRRPYCRKLFNDPQTRFIKCFALLLPRKNVNCFAKSSDCNKKRDLFRRRLSRQNSIVKAHFSVDCIRFIRKHFAGENKKIPLTSVCWTFVAIATRRCYFAGHLAEKFNQGINRSR